MVIVVVMQSYVAKRTPKNIRGMIFAVIGVMAALGSIVYLQLYGLLIRLYYYPAWAFATIGLIDIFMVLFLFLMIFLGKFGDPAVGTDED
jgi:MFS family permease